MADKKSESVTSPIHVVVICGRSYLSIDDMIASLAEMFSDEIDRRALLKELIRMKKG